MYENISISFTAWKPQDLLDDLQAVIDEEPDIYPNWRRVTLCEARDYLKEFFQNREWISVKDRIPADCVDVLTWRSEKMDWCIESYVRGKGWLFDDVDDMAQNPVTHWMTLPEPPKEE